MKNIKELELLVNFAKSLGQAPDPKAVEQIRKHYEFQKKIIESVKANSSNDLSEAFGQKIEKEPIHELVQEKTETERASENPTPSFKSDNRKIIEGNETPSNLTRDSGPQPGTQTLADLTAKFISEAPKDSFQQPDPLIVSDNLDAIRGKLKFLEQWVSKISSAGAGSGEVNFRWLDDVDRSTIAEGRHLAYNATTKKFFFEDVSTGTELFDDDYTTDITDNVVSVINLPNVVIGPIQGMQFDTTHVHTAKDAGTLCWSSNDRTLNIQHPNDVTQQVGQETYLLVRNNTGSTISNATSVRFSGAVGVDGEARLTVAPFLADGTYPSLYTIGITTQDIANDADGFVTVFGKVREIDTTGSSVSETWVLGDILYAHPTIAGALTRVKPTAPYNVVPMAAVVTVDDTDGEIFVRPTIEQKYSYGRFSRTTDASVAATNTAYTITFNSTETSNGVNIGSPTSRLVVDQSGLYQIDINAQVEIAGNNASTGTMYMWLRKNGTDIVNSMRRQGQRGEVPSLSFSYNIVISLAANDYVEVVYAADDTNMRFDATGATAFGPSTAAILIGVTQVQL